LQRNRHAEAMGAQNFNILINVKSGTVLNMGVEAVEAAIEASGIPVVELCMSEPEDMHANLERLADAPDPIIVGGGDGTIRETAKFMAGKRNAFGILPFGTMNLLAADLGFTSLQDALSAYTRGAQATAVDAGYVNGEIFLCCASIGTMPQASVYREKTREQGAMLLIPRMFMFVLENLDRNKSQKVVMDIDGKMHRFRSPAVVISDNRFADTEFTENNFKRVSLTGGELAAYVATTKTRTSHLRFLTRLLIGHWLRDPDVKEMTGRKITVWTKRKNELVSIDGEVVKLPTPLAFTLKPQSVNLLVPVAA
jgi:diacylglycerol kinase family enzyme